MKTAEQIEKELLERTTDLLQEQGAYISSRQVKALAQAVAEQLAEIHAGRHLHDTSVLEANLGL